MLETCVRIYATIMALFKINSFVTGAMARHSVGKSEIYDWNRPARGWPTWMALFGITRSIVLMDDLANEKGYTIYLPPEANLTERSEEPATIRFGPLLRSNL